MIISTYEVYRQFLILGQRFLDIYVQVRSKSAHTATILPFPYFGSIKGGDLLDILFPITMPIVEVGGCYYLHGYVVWLVIGVLDDRIIPSIAEFVVCLFLIVVMDRGR